MTDQSSSKRPYIPPSLLDISGRGARGEGPQSQCFSGSLQTSAFCEGGTQPDPGICFPTGQFADVGACTTGRNFNVGLCTAGYDVDAGYCRTGGVAYEGCAPTGAIHT